MSKKVVLGIIAIVFLFAGVVMVSCKEKPKTENKPVPATEEQVKTPDAAVPAPNEEPVVNEEEATATDEEEAMVNEEAVTAAIAAAEAWLPLIDDGKYAESWEQTAEAFKGAITVEKWEETMKGFRAPLGKLVSRKVQDSNYATSLPGAPDGEYVVIVFETSFENKKTAIETVTPMKDTDGKWRVSGYYIK